MAIVYCFGDTPLHDALAKSSAEALTLAYPNHSWWVECKGDSLIIKHFDISDKIGMVRRISALSADAAAFKRDIIMAAGELLECVGLARGGRNDDPVLKIEAPKHIAKHLRPYLGIS